MTSEVLSAVCQFCVSFGAEGNKNLDCKKKGHTTYAILRSHGKVIISSAIVIHSTQVGLLHLIA